MRLICSETIIAFSAFSHMRIFLTAQLIFAKKGILKTLKKVCGQAHGVYLLLCCSGRRYLAERKRGCRRLQFLIRMGDKSHDKGSQGKEGCDRDRDWHGRSTWRLCKLGPRGGPELLLISFRSAPFQIQHILKNSSFTLRKEIERSQ